MAEAAPSTAKKKSNPLGAIVGWGILGVFCIGFIWIIQGQITDDWDKREDEAKKIVREFKPEDADANLQDLTKEFSIKAKARDAYVGEFSWDAKQKDGPEYEVSLLWKEGGETHQAVWRVSLETKEVRPQGSSAANLPKRAKSGGLEG